MKVTKLIREYVEEQVSIAYDAKVNPYKEQANLDREKIKNFQEELHLQQKELLNNFLSENKLFDDWGNHRPITNISTCTPGFHRYYTTAMLNEKQWENENQRLKSAKIREIMINLELGANRQELNDMIAKLMEE